MILSASCAAQGKKILKMPKTKAFPVTPRIDWVGALDPDMRVFDVIMRTEHGSSYNSYLVKGEKTCLIDGVKKAFFDEWKARIEDAGLQLEQIDYIVLNHTEPDHAGSIAQLLEQAPQIKVLCSRSASNLIKEIVNHPVDIQVVGEGDSFDLGGLTLEFIGAPFLHWPDTIFTYVPEEKAMFTCDAFGFHHCAPGVYDDTLDTNALIDSQKYYFDVIMGPFKEHVLKACDKLDAYAIDVIAPSHGPVLRTQPREAVARYRAWAAGPQVENKALVTYVSCYGYTRMLAEAAADELKKRGVETELLDITSLPMAQVADKFMHAKAVIVGSPTINRDALPPVWQLLTSLDAINTRGKIAAVVGSFGWSGEGVKFATARLEQLNCKVMGSLACKLQPTEADLEKARALAQEVAQAMQA